MQVDIDHYLNYYNTERPHQGRLMEGRTPYAMFLLGLENRPEESVEMAAEPTHRLGTGVRRIPSLYTPLNHFGKPY
jgi:hypothetical protein